MTIADEIQRIKTNIENAYTVCNNKGATIPQNQNSDNLATCINSITGGGSGPSGYIPREIENGTFQMPTTSFTFTLPDDATDLGDEALFGAFYNCTSLEFVDLSSLTTVSGRSALYQAFYSCTSLTSIDLSSLTTVSGSSAMLNAFNNCDFLTSIDLSSLTTVSGSTALSSAFYNCTSLTSIDLSSLTTVSGSSALSNTFTNCTSLISLSFSSLATISGSSALSNAFTNCTSLISLSFPSLTSTSFGSYTTQFNKMLEGVKGCTVHFPSNLQSVIGNWTEVKNGFRGTNTTVSFDLPATENSGGGYATSDS